MISVAYAHGHIAAAQDLVTRINDVFLFPLIALLSAVAFIVFLYGAFEYVRNSASQEGRQTGQRHLLYGVIGLLVMFSAYTILQIAAGTFGVSVGDGAANGSNASFTNVQSQAGSNNSNRAPDTTVPDYTSDTDDTTASPTTAATGNESMYYNDNEIIETYNNQMTNAGAPPISEIYFVKDANDTVGTESEDCYELGGTANTLMVMVGSNRAGSVYVCGK